MKRTAIKRRSPLKKASKRKATTLQLDKLMREYVLLRDKATCLRCKADAESLAGKGRGFALQAAHVFGKGAHPGMRYHPENVITLCQPCHFWWHNNGFGKEAADRPNVVREWCLSVLGREWMDTLDLVARFSGKGKRNAHPDVTRMYLSSLISGLA